MEHTVDSGTLWLVISISAGIILLMFTVIGFFLRTLHGDVRDNTESVGKNKGNIELMKQKQEADRVHLEEITQIKLQALTDNVGDLSKSVNSLVTALIASGIKIDEH